MPCTNESRFIPTLIKGDLDSLRSDVREYYAARVCIIYCDGISLVAIADI